MYGLAQEEPVWLGLGELLDVGVVLDRLPNGIPVLRLSLEARLQ